MDADQIRQMGAELQCYLRQFDDCFRRRDTRAHLPRYVEGQLSDLQRKSVEPMALKANVPVRTLQEFLSQLEWDHLRMRDRLQQMVAAEQPGETIGIIDETGVPKKGDKTPGVQRQYCGAVGKQDNCIVMVNLAYARGGFHCLLDGELFLPESWSQDRPRCREAGIPDDVVYRPKSDIALELYDQARANGVKFDWITFDEWYGAKPEFLRGLDARGQNFVGEVHKHFVAWIDPPKVTTRPFHREKQGRGRKVPRLVAGGPKARHVEDLLKYHPALRDQPWQRWRVKDGEKGPQVWEVKHVIIYPKDAEGLPDKPHHLLVARNVLAPEEIKYFVSNAAPETTVEKLLQVAFSRWRIERCFEDGKDEIGLDHYEGRRYKGLKRHWIISAVSLFFLAKVHARLREKKCGTHSMPGTYGRNGLGALVVAG